MSSCRPATRNSDVYSIRGKAYQLSVSTPPRTHVYVQNRTVWTARRPDKCKNAPKDKILFANYRVRSCARARYSHGAGGHEAAVSVHIYKSQYVHYYDDDVFFPSTDEGGKKI